MRATKMYSQSYADVSTSGSRGPAPSLSSTESTPRSECSQSYSDVSSSQQHNTGCAFRLVSSSTVWPCCSMLLSVHVCQINPCWLRIVSRGKMNLQEDRVTYRVGRGALGRRPCAPRPAPPSKICSPRPAPPSAP
jgi:hypothetical protein